MSNFDDLAMAVASFGGNNAVKFDDLGMPVFPMQQKRRHLWHFPQSTTSRQ